MEIRDYYDRIVVLQVEISNYSCQGIRVKYDFETGILKWSDSHTWNNNFMKSLSVEKIEKIKGELPSTSMLEWMQAYLEDRQDEVGHLTNILYEWEIKVTFDDKMVLSCNSRGHIPNDWNKLRSLIETSSECCFKC